MQKKHLKRITNIEWKRLKCDVLCSKNTSFNRFPSLACLFLFKCTQSIAMQLLKVMWDKFSLCRKIMTPFYWKEKQFCIVISFWYENTNGLLCSHLHEIRNALYCHPLGIFICWTKYLSETIRTTTYYGNHILACSIRYTFQLL